MQQQLAASMLYNKAMVTFAAATKTTSTSPPRAPAQRRVDHFVAITCSDPSDSCDLYSDDCRSHAQLVSPSRDPIGYVDGTNLFGNNFFVTAVDPTGLQRSHGPGKNCDEYWSEFLRKRPGFKDKFPGCWETFTRGCIGITIVNLGQEFGGSPDTSHCFASRDAALAFKSKFTCANATDSPAMFSIHFYWNGDAFQTRKDGSLILGPWEWGDRKPRRKGEIAFDFGFCQGDKIIHADHCDNRDGRIKDRPREPMTVYISTLEEWTKSYANFNQEVWCIACQKGWAKPQVYGPNPIWKRNFAS